MRARPFVAAGLLRVDAAPATANQYVFAWDGVTDGSLYAYTYNDGNYVSTRGNVEITGDAYYPYGWSLIASDSSLTIGDNSLLYGRSYLRVWDVEGGVLYDATPAGNFMGAVYRSGKIYWIESDGINDYDVMQADTDLTNASSVATITHGLGASSALQQIGQTSNALIVEALDSTLTTRKRFRVAFSGWGITESDISAETDYMASIGRVRSDNKMVFLNSDARLCVLDSDSASATVSTVWPDFGLGLSGANPFDLNSAGTQAQFCNGANGYRDATSGSFGGSPDASFTLEENPDGTIATGYLAAFYFGD